MKHAFTAILAAAFLTMPHLATAQTVAPTTPAPVVTTPGTTPPGGFAHHPEMKRAMRHLEEAKAELMKAAHDYSGHRDQAMTLINQAEAQLQAGIADQTHP